MRNNQSRRKFVENIITGTLGIFAIGSCNMRKSDNPASKNLNADMDPTQCAYAPPGEYIKDHSFVYHDGWYHFFSISGTQGYYHGYNGNEETVSWSISKDLVNWEFRGHVLHASQWPGAFDQHEVWAPFCFKDRNRFYMFYAGIIHPSRPMEYERKGHDHPWVHEGHQEAMGLAVSEDLTYWDKIADFKNGLGVKGRDAHVVYDDELDRYLLYSTIGTHQAHVSVSKDLINWQALGICTDFPEIIAERDLGGTTKGISRFMHSAESLHVIPHPLTRKWIMMGNWQYVISDDPTRFKSEDVKLYNRNYQGISTDMGFACEMLELNGKWYRSGVFGERDYWKLGFTEVAWDEDGAFHIIKPSILS
jgi:hypothetical protein